MAEMKRIAVIGGGASGLMAAYAAAKNGALVTLYEKNEKLGKKIYITGKGRCNLTNDCLPDEFLQNVVHGEKFLMGAIWSFPPLRIMEFMESHGLALKTERGNRVFPVSDHASDVTKTLEMACKEAGVNIVLNAKVEKIDILQGTMRGIIIKNQAIIYDGVIVATGGLSYPSTGSTGDGYNFAQFCGHKIVPPVPSLTGLNLAGDYTSIQGISLKNVVLTAIYKGKTISSRMGELLFTHYGISGPLVLSLSAEVNRVPIKEISLYLDFKPALDDKKLDARLLRDFAERKNETIKNVARSLLPNHLVQHLLKKAGIGFDKKVNSITKEERGTLIKMLKKFPLIPVSLRGFDESIVTSGGISLNEVHPKTMESKLIKGLFFCGEVLDVDAFTGGFNMQIAFSTGYLAGESASK